MRFDKSAAEFRDFIRDIAEFAGPGLWPLAILSIIASAAEGVGLMMLIPVLGYLGVSGSGRWEGVTAGLGPALGLYVFLVGGAALVVSIRTTAMAKLRMGYLDHLRRKIHEALLHMEWQAFSRLRGSDAVNILTVEIQRAALGVDFLFRLCAWGLEIAVLLMVSFHLSVMLTGGCLLLALACVLVSRPLNRRIHTLGESQGAANRAVMADINDDLVGMRLIRGLGLADDRRRRLDQRLKDLRQGQLDFMNSMAWNRAVIQTAAAAAAALAVWFSVKILAVELADTLVLMAAFARLAGVALRVLDGWRMVLNALPANAAAIVFLERCQAEAEVPVIAVSERSTASMLIKGIDLEEIGFRYSPDGPMVLSGISGHIPAGGITVIVGPSGAGKSTLADLLSGLMETCNGAIRVDGVVMVGETLAQWRRHIGHVPQDCFLFHDTIRANLRLADPEVTEAELWAVLTAAAAADFVHALPQQLETVVGDRGCQLSGGERQRLTLARALLCRPSLLILDEATGALDSDNEMKIFKALVKLREQLTIVVITHRTSTFHLADQVLRLEGGQLVLG